MKNSKVLSITAALALVLAGFAAFTPSAQAQIRSEKRPDILLIVGGVAAAALLVLLTAGGGSDGNNRPVSP